MKHRILKILICMALILSLASSGLCAVFAPHEVKTLCQKSRSMGKVTNEDTSGSCKMPPCQSKDRQPVLLPNALPGRFKTEDRQAAPLPCPSAILTAFGHLFELKGVGAASKTSLSFHSPPLFYLHCSLIR